MLIGKIRRNRQLVEETFQEALEHLKYYAISPSR